MELLILFFYIQFLHVYKKPYPRACHTGYPWVIMKRSTIQIKKKILVLIPVKDKHKLQLEETAPNGIFTYASPLTVTEKMAAESHIIIGNVPPKLLRASEKLELLQLNSSGADAYIKEGLLAPGTMLASATGAYGKAVSEHMLAMLLSLQKKLHLYRDAQNRKEWADEGEVVSITDSRILVLGLGDIGRSFAALTKALGAYVIGMKRRPGTAPSCVHELLPTEELKQVLPTVDAVVSFLPNTPETKHLFDRTLLSLMKPSAILLNGGRGNSVDPDALYDALSSGALYAAGLDVTDPEPLPPGHRLWSLPNVYITPHVAGKYHLPETLDRIVEIACSNLSSHLDGKPLKNLIDLTTGYCK